MTATHRSRKPVTTQFTARSALHCRQIWLHLMWNFQVFWKESSYYTKETVTLMCCVSYTWVVIFVKSVYIFFSHLKLVLSVCRPFAHHRIFTMKTTRSESPRSLGGKWSEPPPWPEWVASPTIIDCWKRLETRAHCGASFGRGSAHTVFHLFKPLKPCGRACKWTLWAHWTNPNGLYGEQLWMSNPVAELLWDVISLSPAVMQI